MLLLLGFGRNPCPSVVDLTEVEAHLGLLVCIQNIALEIL